MLGVAVAATVGVTVAVAVTDGVSVAVGVAVCADAVDATTHITSAIATVTNARRGPRSLLDRSLSIFAHLRSEALKVVSANNEKKIRMALSHAAALLSRSLVRVIRE